MQSRLLAQLHKAEPHLQTLDLLVFSIGDIIQAVSWIFLDNERLQFEEPPNIPQTFSSQDATDAFALQTALVFLWLQWSFEMRLRRLAGGRTVWRKLCGWFQGGICGINWNQGWFNVCIVWGALAKLVQECKCKSVNKLIAKGCKRVRCQKCFALKAVALKTLRWCLFVKDPSLVVWGSQGQITWSCRCCWSRCSGVGEPRTSSLRFDN